VALGLLVVVVGLELVGAALRPPHRPHPVADVMAVPGVATMVRGAQIDPSELAQVAATPAAHSPAAFPAMALLDALLLVVVAGAGLPRLVAREVARTARFGSFAASLAVLLVGIAVVVAAIARLRFLTALYLSPPFGTLTYLLRYGTFARPAALVALALVMAAKAGACVALARSGVRSSIGRGAAGLAVTSLVAVVVTAACYACAPPAIVPITDALAAAVAGLAAIGWAGVIVSGTVRRLA
jgi:hypothetical protein